MGRMRNWGFAFCAVLVCGAIPVGAQTLGKSKPKVPARTNQTDSAPVTQSEVRDSMIRVNTVLHKVILNKKSPQPLLQPGSKIASREAIIREMSNTLESLRPGFKFTPKPIAFDPKILSIPQSSPNRVRLESLIKLGCIDKYGPLATASGPGLSCEEFGDALGYFVARVADLTHTPSYKYSPALMGG